MSSCVQVPFLRPEQSTLHRWRFHCDYYQLALRSFVPTLCSIPPIPLTHFLPVCTQVWVLECLLGINVKRDKGRDRPTERPPARPLGRAVRLRLVCLFSFENRNPTSRRSKAQKLLHCCCCSNSSSSSKPFHPSILVVVPVSYPFLQPLAAKSPVSLICTPRKPSFSSPFSSPSSASWPPARPPARLQRECFKPQGAPKTPSCNLFGRVVGYTK